MTNSKSEFLAESDHSHYGDEERSSKLEIHSMNMHDPECEFCIELRTNCLPAKYQNYSSIRHRCFMETEHLSVWPTVSPLRFGHILILSKSHVPSFAHVQPSARAELFDVVNNLDAILRHDDSNYAFFEHGLASCNQTGCGVNHAHIHMIWLTQHEQELVKKLFDDILSISCTMTPLDFRRKDLNWGEYALLCLHRHDLFVSLHNTDIPSQTLRKIVARAIGSTSLDWREMINAEIFERMVTNVGMSHSALDF